MNHLIQPVVPIENYPLREGMLAWYRTREGPFKEVHSRVCCLTEEQPFHGNVQGFNWVHLRALCPNITNKERIR